MPSLVPKSNVQISITTPANQTVSVQPSAQSNVAISAGGASFVPQRQAILSTEKAGMALLPLRVVVYDQNDHVIYASASNRSHANRIVGLTIASADEGESVQILRQGLWISNSWNWGDEVILLGENGILTHGMPAVGGFLLQIGQRQTPNSINFNPQSPIFLDA
jgi:hypothetical protein